MKTFYVLFFISIFLFSGCSEKDSSPDTEKDNFEIIFQLSGFKSEIVPMSLKSASPPVQSINDINHINYIIFNSSGDVMYTKSTKRGDAGFGTIHETLPKGNYLFSFIANNGDLSANPMKMVTKGNYYQSDSTYISYPANRVEDTFFYTSSLYNVYKDETHSIKLERAVGRVEVIITDNIPSNAHRLEIAMHKGTNRLSINSKSSWTTGRDSDIMTISHLFSRAEKGTSNFTIAFNSFHTAGGYLQAYCYDSANKLIASKTIQIPLSITPSYLYRFSGSLFSGAGIASAEQDFNITIDKDFYQIITGTF